MRGLVPAFLLCSGASALAQNYGQPTTTTTSTSTTTITKTLIADGVVSTVTSTLAGTSSTSSSSSASSSPTMTIYVPLSNVSSSSTSPTSVNTAPFPLSTGGLVPAPSGTAVGNGTQPSGTGAPIQSFTPGSKASHAAPLGMLAGIASAFGIVIAVGF